MEYLVYEDTHPLNGKYSLRRAPPLEEKARTALLSLYRLALSRTAVKHNDNEFFYQSGQGFRVVMNRCIVFITSSQCSPPLQPTSSLQRRCGRLHILYFLFSSTPTHQAAGIKAKPHVCCADLTTSRGQLGCISSCVRVRMPAWY